MFNMLGPTEAPQKGAPTRGPANFCNIEHAGNNFVCIVASLGDGRVARVK